MELAKVIIVDPFSDILPIIDGKIVATIGQFDGVHKAHAKLIETCVKISKDKDCKSAVICFNPHPKLIINKTFEGTLTNLDDKRKIVSSYGVDYLIVVRFSLKLSNLSYQDFEAIVLDKLNIDTIVCGEDFGYGYKKLGNAETLKEKYNVEVINLILEDNQKIASSQIKKLLIEGNLDKANQLLGHNFSISGIVKKGSQIGRNIGIRTANIEFLKDDSYPEIKSGVYATKVYIDSDKYLGVCNIGHNPSFNYILDERLEVHILDFDGELYGKAISVEFIEYLREEKVFDNPNELVNQINKDILRVREIEL